MRRNIEFNNEGGINYLVLWRDSIKSRTDVCPFCKERHKHGIPDGHRVAHCNERAKGFLGEIFVPEDGVSIFQKDGYIVKTRHR